MDREEAMDRMYESVRGMQRRAWRADRWERYKMYALAGVLGAVAGAAIVTGLFLYSG